MFFRGYFLVVMLARDLVQLAEIEQAREFVKVEHRVVLAVFAEESYVFAEVHIFEVIGNKAAVATLNAFAKFVQNFVFAVIVHKLFEILPYRDLRSLCLQNYLNCVYIIKTMYRNASHVHHLHHHHASHSPRELILVF